VCKQCSLRNSDCRYPSHVSSAPHEPLGSAALAVGASPLARRAPSSLPIRGPTPPAMTFNMREMRFFQQFLTSMPHALPIGNRNVWLNDIPQMAHSQSFLMHAMLALGASDLARAHRNVFVEHDMLRHRGRAILGLKAAVEDAEAWQQTGHADAVLATCYSLTFQASHLPDALQDFGVFVQGCALATEKIRQNSIRTSLNVDPAWPQRKLEAALEHLQGKSLDVPLIARALEGIDQVLTQTTSPFCHAFGRAMQQTMGGFRESAAKGFLLSSLSYNSWYELGSGLLQAFQDPQDTAPMILGAYFVGDIALSKAIIPLHLFPDTSRAQLPAATLKQMGSWVEAITAMVSESQRILLAWPNEMMARVDALLQGLEYHSPPSLTMEEKFEILGDLKTR
jgi:hypothetical protein